MKNLVLFSAIAGAFLLSGCNEKKSTIHNKPIEQNHNQSTTHKVNEDNNKMPNIILNKENISYEIIEKHIENGNIKFTLIIKIDPKWQVYAYNNQSFFGKPMNMELELDENNKIKIDLNSTKYKPEEITIKKQTMISGQEQVFESKIFEHQIELEVNIHDEKINPSKELFLHIEGSMCEKEEESKHEEHNKHSTEKAPEQCSLINEKIKIN